MAESFRLQIRDVPGRGATDSSRCTANVRSAIQARVPLAGEGPGESRRTPAATRALGAGPGHAALVR